MKTKVEKMSSGGWAIKDELDKTMFITYSLTEANEYKADGRKND